eukprot:TRINITY_DN3520_c1_g1_i1.p1 TRINITY_DN3520_c1_g1~~TRINITY_DN3520_c1_g1_i1.p1  ORF type:complete len:108 (+),score=31.81 TRINITY_DN3520_c1_g1_i1:348-671(+)
MFVKAKKTEVLTIVENENDIFEACGKRILKTYRQKGKEQRLKDLDSKFSLDDYFGNQAIEEFHQKNQNIAQNTSKKKRKKRRSRKRKRDADKKSKRKSKKRKKEQSE